MFMCVYVCTCLLAYVWRSEDNLSHYFPGTSPPCYFAAESLPLLELWKQARLAAVSPTGLPASTDPAVSFTHVPHQLCFVFRGAGA